MATLYSLLPLLGTVVLAMLATGLTNTLIPLRLASESPGVVGWITALYYAGMLGGTLQTARHVARVGHVRVLLAALAALGATAAAHPLVGDLGAWAMLRLVAGAALGALFVAVESWLNAHASERSRGRVMGLYLTAASLGVAGGPLLAALPDPHGFVGFNLAAMLCAVAAMPVALSVAPEPVREPAAPSAVMLVARRAPFGFAGSVASGLTLGAFYGLTPLFAVQMGLSDAGAARFVSVSIAAGLLAQLPVGALSDRLPRDRVLAGVLLVLTAAALLNASLPIASLWASAAFGLAAFAIYPVSASLVNERVGGAGRVAAGTGILIAYGVGASVGPLLAGQLMAALGPGGLYLFFAAVAGMPLVMRTAVRTVRLARAAG